MKSIGVTLKRTYLTKNCKKTQKNKKTKTKKKQKNVRHPAKLFNILVKIKKQPYGIQRYI